MITFKDFLIESRSAPLYHATSFGNLESIFKYGFKPKTYQLLYKSKGQATHGRYGVSFARSMRAADNYMKTEFNDDLYVIIEVDQQKIHSNYKITPVDYFGTHVLLGSRSNDSFVAKKRSETEEFVTVPHRLDDSGKYGRSIPQKVINAIYYFDIKKPTEFEREYVDEIARLKRKYIGYKWIARN